MKLDLPKINFEERNDIIKIIENLTSKLTFEEKPIHYDISLTNIINRRKLCLYIQSLAYLNEVQIQKLAGWRKDSIYLNKIMKLFFKLINFRHKIQEIDEYLSWIKDKYIIDQYKIEKVEKKTKSTNEELIGVLDEIQINELNFKELEPQKTNNISKT